MSTARANRRAFGWDGIAHMNRCGKNKPAAAGRKQKQPKHKYERYNAGRWEHIAYAAAGSFRNDCFEAIDTYRLAAHGAPADQWEM